MVENKPNALEIRNVKFATILVILLAVSMMLAAALPDAASGSKDVANAKITSLVLSEMAQAGFDDKIPVIVIMHEQPSTPVKRGVLPEQLMSMKSLAGTSQQDIVQMLRMEGSSSVGRIEQLWLVNAVSVEASPATIMKMAQRDDVARIEPDLEVNAIDSDNDQFSPSLFDKLLNKDPMISPPKDKVKPTDIIRDYPSTYEDIAWGVEWIEAPALWARGINGSGINVSIIDTGINAQHPDLQGKVVAWKDFTKNIPFSGTSAWYSGKGDNLTNTLTRTFDLSGVSSATLEFEGCYELEYGYNSTTEEYIYYDAGYVNVSTDSGVTWDTIEVYQGQSDGYMHEELDLTPYIGNSSVMVRFAYVTDGSYHWEGWYIDDITIPETGYFDGAESGIGDWTTDGWEIKDNTVYWPNGNAWYSGAGNDLYNTLEQSFNLSGVNGATLNFTTRYDMEGGCDYGYVRASTGSGWTTLATYNGYSDWTDESIDLSSYAGYNVTIRFLYDTDDSVSYEGWFIDNIGISEIPFSDDVESGEGGWTADGWYIVGPDTPYDDQGHGTHVAGTVAGTGADWLKTGVAPGANLMGAKVLDNWGSGSMSDVIRGVEWSVENGADVVSLSLGMNPIDGGDGYGDLNESETAVENITVFTNPFVDTPFKTDTPTAYQPTYIIGLVGFREDTCVWEADGYSISTLTRTFNLTDITSATLEFGTAYEECYGNSIGEVQASTDGVTWETLVDYSGNSYEWLEGSRWINESISLDDYTGDNVTLRFLFDPYYDGYWQIDNIAIPKMGFYDNVETGNSGWTASGWYIDDTWRAVDITNADISLNAPDGTAVSGDEMDWLFEGVVPENLWIYKYTPAVPLQAGEWNLTVTSNFNGTLDYCAELVVGYPTDGTDAASQALDTAAGLGVVPVVAAGNDGELGLHTIGSPGASGSAITVGATDCYMDYIARFSSRGPVGFDTSEIIKPDVVAPGTDIGSTYYLGDYAWMSGTSMATPHVAGATALLLQADPSLTPAQVKQTLMDTSVDLGESGKDNSYGAGRISAYAAVNATVDLPEPVSERPDQYELFAGATVDEIYLPPFIRDTVGDADDYADITNVGVSSDDTQLGIYIYTEGAPDLTLAGFRFGMDTDRNTSTGNNADIPELGRDYGVRINDTGYYLYRWDANVNDRVWIQNIDGWVSDDCVYFSIPFSAINETQSSVRMNAVAGSFTPDGTLLDEAPDAGYGTYPWLDVTIDMVGISWNDRTGLPEQGMNITFDVKQYRSYPYYDYITIASITNTTNSQGMATAVVHVNQTDDWEQYHVYISDEYGNEIDDYVYADADYSFLYERPFFIPSWRDYHAAMNSTLSVKLTMVTQDWEPYNENVTLVFGDRWDSRGNVSVELTPVNGTIEYDLDLSTTDIDENYLDSWYYDLPIQILNGTLEDYDCAEFVGYLYIYDDEWYNLELSPEMAGASAGSNISYLVETYISNMSTDRPVSDGLTVEVVWIDEVEVKKLGVQPSILGKLDRMRAQMEDTGRNDNLLTGDEQQKLVEALNGLEPQNIGINYTAFDITTDTNGLDQFDVDVPLDAYMGFVWIDGETDGHWYYDESIVFVFENFDWYHHPSAPHPEIVDYDLDIYAHWDSTTVDGIIIPDNNITVEIWLEQYDPQLDDWDDVPYEDVYLYTTTSDTKRVTTDADGYACVNFTAPSLDVLNSSWAERRVQVWGITSLLTPYGKIAVAEDDWAHLRIHFNHSRPTLEINNNNLDVTLEFKDETWTDTTNVPTVLDVVKSYTDYWWWSSTKDIMSAYINSPTSVWQTFIPLTEYGTYSVYSSVDYPSPGYNSWCVWIDRISFTPFDIGSDIQYEYPRNTEQPITVTVLDLQGQPVEGASVYIVEQDFWYDDDHYSESSVAGSGGGSSAAGSGGGSSAGWNHIDLATTNSEGTATLTLKTPDHDTELWYRIGGATSEFMFPYVESGLFQVTEPSNQPNLRASINMPSVIEAGVGTSITGKVYNYGYVPSNASVLRLYVNDVSLTDITIDVIQPDEYTDFSQQWTPTSSGTYQIKAEADATDTNDESNENDNINIKSVTASLPDLVSAITMPAVTQPGTTVDISVTVSNTGGIDAGASSLLITVNDTAYNTSSVPAIAAHGSAIVRVPWTPAVEGDYWINVTADSGSVISELSETNNGASMLVAVINQTTMSITSFSLGVGSNVTVPVMVNNANEVAGGSVNITFDQSVVNVQDITGGNFGLATVNINNSNGYVYIAVSRATAVGIRGAVLANVTFAGISAGSTALDLTQAKVNDEIGNITIVPVSNGTVTVYQWPLGDLNHNYRLDTGDATLALRMVVKLIPEDLLGDMNANGGIDTGDATLILRKVVGFD